MDVMWWFFEDADDDKPKKIKGDEFTHAFEYYYHQEKQTWLPLPGSPKSLCGMFDIGIPGNHLTDEKVAVWHHNIALECPSCKKIKTRNKAFSINSLFWMRTANYKKQKNQRTKKGKKGEKIYV